MDAHLLALMAPALERALAGARIEKIQEFAPNHLGLAFYAPGGKRYLYARFDRQKPFCFLSTRHCTGLSRPAPHVMRLRKYCGGRKITSVVTQIWSRKLWLHVSGGCEDKNTWLCLNLAREPELHFLEENTAPEIEMAYWPLAAELQAAMLEWQRWPVLTPGLRKALTALDDPEKAALIADLADGGGSLFQYRDKSGKIRKISAWPLSGEESLSEEIVEPSLASFEDAGNALVMEALARQQEEAGFAPINKRIKKLNRLLLKLNQDELRLGRMIGREKDALFLRGNLWRIDADYRGETLKIESSDGVCEIQLDRRFTVIQNMERMFHEVRRGKRGLAMLQERRAGLEKELALLKNGTVVAQAPIPERRQSGCPAPLPAHCGGFVSSDGYQILRGKDAKGNRAIRKLASPHDIWVHVEQGAGAHVIIRRSHAAEEIPERTLLEGGTLAANKSWLAGASSGKVMYAELRHVKSVKKGPPGKVAIDKIKMTRVVPVDIGLEEQLLIRMEAVPEFPGSGA